MKLALSIPGFSNIDTGNPMLTPLPKGVPTGGLETTGADAIRVFIYFILTISILTALWFMVKGGIDIIQSQGQKENLKSGRERVIFAVFGLIMVFASFLFMNIIGKFIGIDFLCLLLRPASSCL